MIITLRGTNGSGKTHLVRQLISRYGPGEEVLERDKCVGLILPLPDGRRMGLVGPYRTACGGADTIQPFSRILGLIDRLAGPEKCQVVLAEGSLVSSSHGSLGRHIDERYGKRCVYVFMGTSPERCVRNVKARRKQKGNDRPLDPYNLYHKYHSVHLSILKIRDLFKLRTVVLDPDKALSGMIRLITYGYDPETANPNGLSPLPGKLQEYLRRRGKERKSAREQKNKLGIQDEAG